MVDGKTVQFDDLALPHMNSVLRAALALCGRIDLAEDLTQTTFVKALEKFDSFQPGTNCKAWLLGILRNTWIDHLRHQKVAGKALDIEDFVPAAPPEEGGPPARDAAATLEAFSDAEVIRALARLPEDRRLTLYLIDVEEMSYQEAAAITDVPVGTVKSRTSHARAAMREMLAAHAGEMGFIGRRRHAPDE